MLATERLLRIASDRNSACCLRSSGTRPMPARMASIGERIATSRPSTSTRPRCDRVGAEDGAGELGAAGADQAGEAQDLALAHLEADVVRASTACGSRASRPRAMPSTVERHRAGAGVARGGANSRSTSRPTIMRMIRSTSSSAIGGLAGQRAVAQHGGAVADLHHLLEPVGDEHDRDAPGLEPAHDREQALDLLVGQGRGRLVHDHELGRPSTAPGRSRPSAARRPRGRRPAGAGRRRARPPRSAPRCGDAARPSRPGPAAPAARPMNTFSATDRVGIRLNSW